MKKLLLSFLTVLTASSFTATAKEVLSEITSASGIEHVEFTYNDKGLLVKQDNTDEYGKHYTLLSYDADDHIIRIETHQILQGTEDYTLVNYIDYQYNDKGQLSQRENYNYDSWEGSYIKGGRIVYSYNELGLVTEENLYMTEWGTTNEVLRQKIVYSYNESNQLIEEDTKMTDYFDPETMFSVSLIAYTYDSEGRRASSSDYYFDTYGPTPDTPILQGTTKYTYDENGLCLYERINAANTVEGKDEYTFATESADETIYPYDIETPNSNFIFASVKKRIATRTEYATDMMSGELGLYDTYTYHYAPNQAGVATVTRPEYVLTVFNNGENVVLGGLNAGEKVMVFDLSGKMVVNRTASAQRMSLSGLESGVYVARSATGVVKFSVK